MPRILEINQKVDSSQGIYQADSPYNQEVEHRNPISILYLGKRGGGAELTLILTNELKESPLFELKAVGLRRDVEVWSRTDQSYRVEIVPNGYTLQTILKVIALAINPSKLLEKLNLQPGDACLIPMISPLGLIVEAILKKSRINVIRLIHDFKKHPGEFFPPNWLTRKILKKSIFLITLSEAVDKRIKEKFSKIRTSIYPHPDFGFIGNSAKRMIQVDYLLFIGRLRSYKGVMNLIEAMKSISGDPPLLVIAGEGDLKIKSHSRIATINKWLSEAEISNLVQNAEIIVFPYIEASQSGLIPFCISSGKKIVITPLEGLLEQTSGYTNVFISKDLDPASLATAIEIAIKAPIQEIGYQMNSSKTIESCLLESGFFTKE